jgi:Membrane protease subunits, stomatin/prohibitin homologs
MDLKVKGIISGVIGVFALLLVIGSITTIETGERGVVTRMGKLHSVMDEGLNFKLPIVDNVTKISIRESNFPIKAEVSSRDMQTVLVDVSLIYSVNPMEIGTLYQRFGTSYQDILVAPTLAEITNSIIAEYPIESFVEKRSEISDRIRAAFVEKTQGNGLIVKSLLITNHDFSDEFNNAIESKKVAEQNAMKAKYELEAKRQEAEAQKIKHASLTQEVLQEMAINKWDGKLPTYWGGNGPLPVMNFGK